MFEKLRSKAVKGTLEDVKGALKEEIVKSSDSILPAIFGFAAVALLVISNVPPQKLPKQAIPNMIINNFYI